MCIDPRSNNHLSFHSIIRIKKSMESYLDKVNKPYSKYINWPSCDSTDWMWRYWGQNYNRLLDIKVRLDSRWLKHQIL